MHDPRERLLALGVERLSDEELVTIIVGKGRSRKSAGFVAAELLRAHGGLAGLRRRSPPELWSMEGIGPVIAARLLASFEVGVRALRPTDRFREPLRDSRAVFERFGRPIAQVPVERFVVVAVDAKNRPRAERTVALGGRTSCQVDPAEVFRWLIAESAAGAVCLHNHPSGDTEPSRDDLELTARLVDAGALLGVRILDHLIVGNGGYRSLRDAGLWPVSPMKSGSSGS